MAEPRPPAEPSPDGAGGAESERAAPSLAEFLTWPETDPPSEYLAGRVVEKPPLQGRELWLRADLTALLYGWARASGLGAVASQLRCTFADASLVPDLVYFAPERRPPEPTAQGGGVRAAPDLAVAVCPASVDPAWVGQKLAYTVAHGVQLAWLVDPTERTVTVYRAGAAPETLSSGGMLDGGTVLPRFFLFLDDLFDVLDAEE